MKKVLIDLNIILDMLGKRIDHEAAAFIFDECVKGEIKGYISSHEITTLAYFLEKAKYNRTKRNRIINIILDALNILAAQEKTLKDALNSQIEDYEDAVIDELSSIEKIDFIVTRDQKDFKKGKTKTYTAVEAIEILKT